MLDAVVLRSWAREPEPPAPSVRPPTFLEAAVAVVAVVAVVVVAVVVEEPSSSIVTSFKFESSSS